MVPNESSSSGESEEKDEEGKINGFPVRRRKTKVRNAVEDIAWKKLRLSEELLRYKNPQQNFSGTAPNGPLLMQGGRIEHVDAQVSPSYAGEHIDLRSGGDGYGDEEANSVNPPICYQVIKH